MRQLVLLSAMALSAMFAAADVVDIATLGSGGTGSGWHNVGSSTSGVVGQTFLVESGYKCTHIEAYIEKGGDVTAAYIATIQVWDSGNNLITSQAVSSADFAHWLTVDVDIAAGSYYWLVTGNNTTFKNKMFVWENVSNPYPNGYAAMGWGAGTPIPGSDFASNFTIEAVPEPATLAVVSGGLGLCLLRKKRK